MSESSPTIFISAAEASGDAHASGLIRALRQRLPDARLVGVGGPMMAGAGCEMAVPELADITHKASMLGNSLLRIGYYYKAVKRLKRAIAEIRPDIHVPVDLPALNWHLAAAAKKAGGKVVHYVAPQLWAWAPWRVRKLIKLTDHVACILPFEQDWLRQRDVPATYVGHPLFDDLPARPEPMPDLIEAWDEGTWQLALLPGSRPAEIRNHAQALAAVGHRIQKRWSGTRCTMAAVNEKAAHVIRESLDNPDDVEIAVGKTRDVLARSHFAIAASGTITLEIAHFGVPMVVLYRVNRLAYSLIGRWLVRMPHLSLVNILAGGSSGKVSGRPVVPEMMPWFGSVRKLRRMVFEMMDDLGYLLEVRKALLDLAETLRVKPPQSASGNAADLIVDVLNGRV